MTARNLEASVRAKLFIHAKTTKQDFQRILTQYARERMLYRLGQSSYVDQFWLKGASLFELWFDTPHRPTRDVDFLGHGTPDTAKIQQIFQEIVGILDADGISFDSERIRVEEIRKAANYPGVRMHIPASIGQARCDLQVDIGFGDVVIPGPERIQYPAILVTSSIPELQVYPQYSVVSEKFESVTKLGMANTRIKDFFDLWFLQQFASFDGPTLAEAVQATFQRRQTPVPNTSPIGVTPVFFRDTQKQVLWAAFLRKNALEAPDLPVVAEAITDFLMPIVLAVAAGEPFVHYWPVGGPWV